MKNKDENNLLANICQLLDQEIIISIPMHQAGSTGLGQAWRNPEKHYKDC